MKVFKGILAALTIGSVVLFTGCASDCCGSEKCSTEKCASEKKCDSKKEMKK